MKATCIRIAVHARLLGGIVLICTTSAAFGEDESTPFPGEEVSRLTAEIRKDPENDELRRDFIDLLRGRTLRMPAEGTYKLLDSAAMLEDTGKPDDLKRAITIYKRVANSVPWYVSVYMNLGLAYEKTRDWAQAKRYYDLFLYAGADYSMVPAELSIIREALHRVEDEIAKGRK